MDNFTREELADTLRLLRHARKWGAKQLASRTGMSKTTIYNIENRRGAPGVLVLQAMLGAMGYDWQALIAAREFLRKVRALEKT